MLLLSGGQGRGQPQRKQLLLVTLAMLTLQLHMCTARPHVVDYPEDITDNDPLLQQLLITLEDEDGDNSHSHGRIVRSVRDNDMEHDAEFWRSSARASLRDRLENRPRTGRARNLILFLGDGMSIPTLVAARILSGGESSLLSFEKFPYSALSKTYCVDSQVADSACTSTAYLCGVKTNLGTIGVTAAVKRANCSASLHPENRVDSILKWAQDAGKATGIVTTTRVTHASPAGAYAHAATRDWESDRDVLKDDVDPAECPDIADQLVNGPTGSKINVILGGGRREFRPKKFLDEEGEKGRRKDNRNLVDEWLTTKRKAGKSASFVWNRQDLLDVEYDNTDYLMGLFESSHMHYNLTANPEKEPSLTDMTSSAIRLLSRRAEGFFLFVEGGKIDLAHHKTRAHRALDETLELARAVQTAVDLTDPEETLIVVTADHAHTMSISGYPSRGNDIFGLAGISNVDKLPLTTLSYANGPGYKAPSETGGRYDVTGDDMKNDSYKFPATAPRSTETHGGDDVAVFSRGPWAHLLTGVVEQNLIPHVMAYAACIGPQDMCPAGADKNFAVKYADPPSALSTVEPMRASPSAAVETIASTPIPHQQNERTEWTQIDDDDEDNFDNDPPTSTESKDKGALLQNISYTEKSKPDEVTGSKASLVEEVIPARTE